ncbi:MAG: PAS domain S-box protein [Acidobacteriia bacterium]|nr:PAS domain S-box protein [Terriglobia bacterium]
MKPIRMLVPFSVRAVKSFAQRLIGRRGLHAGESRAYILAFALGVVTLGGFLAYQTASSYRKEMDNWKARQSSVADDRAQMVSAWLNERQASAELSSTRPSLLAALRAYYSSARHPGRPTGELASLVEVLDQMAKVYGYAGVFVVDCEARLVAQSNDSLALTPILGEISANVIRTGATRIDLLGNVPSGMLISFSVPVFPEAGPAAASGPPTKPLGAALLVLDATRTLFPLVTRESVPTRSGETVLVRREGNDIVFFSPLRHVRAGSPNLRFPLPSAPFPARAALEGHEASVEATDYRGVPVLTATRHIPLTGWGLVRKIDRAEALEDFQRMAIVEGLAAGLLVLLLGGILAFHRRHVLTRVLRQEGERFRSLLESAPDSMVVADSQGRIVLANLQTERQFGYPRAELLGQSIEALMAEPSRAEYRERFHRHSSNFSYQHSGPCMTPLGRRKDASEFPIEVLMTPLESPEGILLISAIRDITVRKQAEEMLRKSEASLEEAQRMAHLGNWEWDVVSDRAWWSDEMCRIFGLNPGSSTHTLESSMNCMHSEDRALVENALKEALEGGKPYNIDYRIIRPDGSERVVHGQGEILFAEGHKPVRMVGTVQDITERKQAEEEIRRLNAELEQRVIERTTELAAANRELEAFAYSVSHDLRAPLRAIDGFGQVLLEDYREKLDAEGQGYLRRVRAASQRMAQLIDDMLSLSRITRQEMLREPVDLSALARSIASRLQAQQPERNLELMIADDAVVEGDRRLLEVMLENLLSNAWKFTRKQPHARIEFGKECTEGDGKAVYFVRDNGAGFDMAYADKLFGAFQRLHAQGDFEGTGVGLATAQRIIHRHGGRIWARGEVDKGATFYFTL